MTAGWWLAAILAAASEPEIDLSGIWTFELDPEDRGVQERWFARSFSGRLRLPGSLQEQGFGDEVTPETKWTGSIVDRSYFTSPRFAKYRVPGNVKYPCWLQPRKTYVGPAWYQREVEVPAGWMGRRLELVLERPHWGTRVWLDEIEVGSADSLSTPHWFDLGRSIPAGRHRLTIRVDNRLLVEVGVDAHSVCDHTQSNWNGIVGRLALVARPAVWIEDIQVYPDAGRRTARVTVRVGNSVGASGRATLRLSARAPGSEAPAGAAGVELTTAGGVAEVDLPLGESALFWDEFNPVLHRLQVNLQADAGGMRFEDRAEVAFGLRTFCTEGTQFTINGRKKAGERSSAPPERTA
ncbi:MAG: sugar-binding domain-containing protein [Planctomycetota bacterium]